MVPNSSFELYTTCPFGGLSNNVLLNWFNPNNGLIEPGNYYNECAINFGNSIPLNADGYEYAATGKGYIEMILYSQPTLRQYYSVKLNSSLNISQFYLVSLKYSCADSAKKATKNFGIYFSDTPTLTYQPYSVLPFAPQIRNNTGFLNNTNGWVTLSFLYKANGTEQYLTMGNFDNDVNTETQTIGGSKDYAGIYIDDVSVTPYNCFVNPVKDTSLCTADTLRIQLNNPMASYMWQDGSTVAQYNITQPGTYTVTTTAPGCTRTDTIRVSPQTATPFSLGNNTTICNNEPLVLNGPANYTQYLWQDGSTNPQYTVTQPGLYWLQATKGNCAFRDSISIAAINCVCTPLIPTAFTPNGDGNNDGFAPTIRCATTQYQLVIFNRYGQTIFNSNNPLQKWNGTYKGLPCNNGSYVYQLQYALGNGILQKTTGSVLLVR
ncbi:gliding motility-associated C-terminal domain-containing protein [Ferruginibacter yonginensis]|uniref:Gliding motility-associated C-terminal domain-containing protein n=1 Tax=Ferruginibacter yonginensis TaxID=1310416 RepID=A0ABV8QU41_9BACT